ncbi:MAG: helix-turn-helix domain-containing protein [Candidatus Aenigmatarchaeota archaeon]
MKSVFEILVQEILPAARSVIAKKLTSDYGLSQKQAAEKLGISQPAISQYNRNVRGSKLRSLNDNEEALKFLESLAKRIAENEIRPEDINNEFFELLKYVKAEIPPEKMTDLSSD